MNYSCWDFSRDFVLWHNPNCTLPNRAKPWDRPDLETSAPTFVFLPLRPRLLFGRQEHQRRPRLPSLPRYVCFPSAGRKFMLKGKRAPVHASHITLAPDSFRDTRGGLLERCEQESGECWWHMSKHPAGHLRVGRSCELTFSSQRDVRHFMVERSHLTNMRLRHLHTFHCGFFYILHKNLRLRFYLWEVFLKGLFRRSNESTSRSCKNIHIW